MATETTSPFQCFCGLTYWYTQDLEEHRRARQHFPSHVCGQHCAHIPSGPLQQELSFCVKCSERCERRDILEDHHIVTGHGEIRDPRTRKSQRRVDFFCRECGMLFLNARELAKHVKRHPPTVARSGNERKKVGCKTCGKHFYSFVGLELHMQSKAHGFMTCEAVGIKSIKCKGCNKMFMTVDAQEEHINSTRHKPLSSLICPMNAGCKKHFSSPSALLYHLENGACRSGMGQIMVFQTVQACDTAGAIHDPIRTALPETAVSSLPTALPSTPIHTARDSPSLEFYDTCIPDIMKLYEEGWSPALREPSRRSSNAGGESSLVNPEQSSSPLSRQVSQSSLSEILAVAPIVETPTAVQSMLSHSPVATLDAPSASISKFNSPPQDAGIYFCPRITMPGIESLHAAEGSQRRSFKTLGALADHIESGACHGGKEAALEFMRMVEEHLQQVGFGEVKLLLH